MIEINFWAVIVVAVLTFALGGVWYSRRGAVVDRRRLSHRSIRHFRSHPGLMVVSLMVLTVSKEG